MEADADAGGGGGAESSGGGSTNAVALELLPFPQINVVDFGSIHINERAARKVRTDLPRPPNNLRFSLLFTPLSLRHFARVLQAPEDQSLRVFTLLNSSGTTVCRLKLIRWRCHMKHTVSDRFPTWVLRGKGTNKALKLILPQKGSHATPEF